MPPFFSLSLLPPFLGYVCVRLLQVGLVPGYRVPGGGLGFSMDTRATSMEVIS